MLPPPPTPPCSLRASEVSRHICLALWGQCALHPQHLLLSRLYLPQVGTGTPTRHKSDRPQSRTAKKVPAGKVPVTATRQPLSAGVPSELKTPLSTRLSKPGATPIPLIAWRCDPLLLPTGWLSGISNPGPYGPAYIQCMTFWCSSFVTRSFGNQNKLQAVDFYRNSFRVL